MSSTNNNDAPMLDPEGFAELIESRMRVEDDLDLRERDGLMLSLGVGSSDVKLNLSNFYQVYAQEPAQLDAVIETVLRAARNYDEARQITSFDSLRERVYPMLKPISMLAKVRERKLPMLLYRPFLADLIIAYVIDEPASVAYINEQHMERWQIAEHELHEQAMRNLRTRTEQRGNYTVAGEGEQRLVIYNTQDGFDATRLLLSDVLEGWRPQFPGNVVIGVPNRDFLIAFSDADDSVLSAVARQIQLDAAQREHGLTDQLFTLINGEVREYQWD